MLFIFSGHSAPTQLHSFPTRRSSISVPGVHGLAAPCHRGDEARHRVHLPHPVDAVTGFITTRSEEHTSELQSRVDIVCRLLLEKIKTIKKENAQQHPKSKAKHLKSNT